MAFLSKGNKNNNATPSIENKSNSILAVNNKPTAVMYNPISIPSIRTLQASNGKAVITMGTYLNNAYKLNDLLELSGISELIYSADQSRVGALVRLNMPNIQVANAVANHLKSCNQLNLMITATLSSRTTKSGNPQLVLDVPFGAFLEVAAYPDELKTETITGSDIESDDIYDPEAGMAGPSQMSVADRVKASQGTPKKTTPQAPGMIDFGDLQ